MELLDLLDFYVNHHNCWTLYEPNIECQHLRPTIKMLSPFGKCHIYLMGDNNSETYVDKIALYTGDAQGELRTYLKRNIYSSFDRSFTNLDIQSVQSNRYSISTR